MSRKKETRNKQLFRLREKNPNLYSFSKLGEIFRITKQTAHEIYRREKEQKSSGKEGKRKKAVRSYPQGLT